LLTPGKADIPTTSSRGRKPGSKNSQGEEKEKIELTPEEIARNEGYYNLLLGKVKGNLGLLSAEYPYHTNNRSDKNNLELGMVSMCSLPTLKELEQTQTGKVYIESKKADNLRPFELKPEITDQTVPLEKSFPPCAEAIPAKFVCTVKKKRGKMCGVECGTIFELRIHLRDHHSYTSKQNPVCPVCLQLFTDSEKRHAHMQSHIPVVTNPPVSFLCVCCILREKEDQCVLVFKQISRLRDHQIMHLRNCRLESRFYYCGICDKPHDKETKRGDCQTACIRNKTKFRCVECNLDFGYDVKAKYDHFFTTHIEKMFHVFLHKLGSKPEDKNKKRKRIIAKRATGKSPGFCRCPEENCDVSFMYDDNEDPYKKIWKKHFLDAHDEKASEFISDCIPKAEHQAYYKELFKIREKKAQTNA